MSEQGEAYVPSMSFDIAVAVGMAAAQWRQLAEKMEQQRNGALEQLAAGRAARESEREATVRLAESQHRYVVLLAERDQQIAALREAMIALRCSSSDGEGCFDPAAKFGNEWIRWQPCEREHNERCKRARALVNRAAGRRGGEMRTVTEAMDDFQRITEEWVNWSWRLEALVLANPVECHCWCNNGRNGSQGHIGACEEWRQVASAIRTKSKMVAGPAATDLVRETDAGLAGEGAVEVTDA